MTIKPHDSNRSFGIMIGNYSDKSTVLLKTINAGIDGYILKPYNLIQITQTLNNIIQKLKSFSNN